MDPGYYPQANGSYPQVPDFPQGTDYPQVFDGPPGSPSPADMARAMMFEAHFGPYAVGTPMALPQPAYRARHSTPEPPRAPAPATPTEYVPRPVMEVTPEPKESDFGPGWWLNVAILAGLLIYCYFFGHGS